MVSKKNLPFVQLHVYPFSKVTAEKPILHSQISFKSFIKKVYSELRTFTESQELELGNWGELGTRSEYHHSCDLEVLSAPSEEGVYI